LKPGRQHFSRGAQEKALSIRHLHRKCPYHLLNYLHLDYQPGTAFVVSLSLVAMPSREQGIRSQIYKPLESSFHSGGGKTHCLLSRLVYSLPEITSSAAVTRNFLSLGFEDNDTMTRSSSLSTQAGSSPPSVESYPNSSASEAALSVRPSGTGAPVSTKNSCNTSAEIDCWALLNSHLNPLRPRDCHFHSQVQYYPFQVLAD
jgi:hypothetical protein